MKFTSGNKQQQQQPQQQQRVEEWNRSGSSKPLGRGPLSVVPRHLKSIRRIYSC